MGRSRREERRPWHLGLGPLTQVIWPKGSLSTSLFVVPTKKSFNKHEQHPHAGPCVLTVLRRRDSKAIILPSRAWCKVGSLQRWRARVEPRHRQKCLLSARGRRMQVQILQCCYLKQVTGCSSRVRAGECRKDRRACGPQFGMAGESSVSGERVRSTRSRTHAYTRALYTTHTQGCLDGQDHVWDP